MLLLSQAPGGALSLKGYALSSPPTVAHPNHAFTLSKCKYRFIHRNPNKPLTCSLSSNEGEGGSIDSASAIKRRPSVSSPTTPPPSVDEDALSVDPGSVPLEGVIQFDKPGSSRLKIWWQVGLLAAGDVLALLLFSAIGRFSHGFSVFDVETLRIADPFVAGWFLSAYFLGGYGEDGRGTNGITRAFLAASKSWSLGIPLGLIIRAATLGHLPPFNFATVTLGSTSVLLIGWRMLFLSIFPSDKGNRREVYKHGSPFELFEIHVFCIGGSYFHPW